MREIRKLPRGREPADHRGDRQGDEGRPREVHRGRAPGTTCPSRSTPSSCWRCCGPGCTAERRGTAADDAGAHDADEPTQRQHPDRRRPAGEAARLRHASSRSWARTSSARARARRRCSRSCEQRVRGHPARRQHAGHGRPRDRRADPPAQAVRAHADHLHHRLRRRDADRAAAIRSARSTTSCRRSCRRCCAPRCKVFVELYLMQRRAAPAGRGARRAGARPRRRARVAEENDAALDFLARGQPRAERLARRRAAAAPPARAAGAASCADGARCALRRRAAAQVGWCVATAASTAGAGRDGARRGVRRRCSSDLEAAAQRRCRGARRRRRRGARRGGRPCALPLVAAGERAHRRAADRRGRARGRRLAAARRAGRRARRSRSRTRACTAACRSRSTSAARAEAQLQEANRRKDEFLAMLAHELRNPLAPIRNARRDHAPRRRRHEPKLSWAHATSSSARCST